MKLPNLLKPGVFFLTAAVLAASCKTAQPPPAAAPAAVVADSAITAAEMAAVFGETETEAKPAESADDVLTPEKALRIAAEKNPSFAEYAAVREVAVAEVMAATAWKNPSLEAGLGRGKTRGSPSDSDWEYSLGLIQPIEWPGKRGTRKAAAEAGLKSRSWTRCCSVPRCAPTYCGRTGRRRA